MFGPVTLALLSTSLSASLPASSTSLSTSLAEQSLSTLESRTTPLATLNTTSSNVATTSSLQYHKQFEFDYGSTSNDALEVDVEIQNAGSSYNEDWNEDGPDALERRGTSNSFNALLQSIQGDDVVWVTRYTGGTTTLPIPATTVTQTVTGTTTVGTTATLVTTATTTVSAATVTAVSTDLATSINTVFSTNWQTVTVTAPGSYYTGATATVTVTELEPTSEFSQALQSGSTNDCSAQNQQAFQLGYVNGAEWGYTVGYNDGSRGRPFVVPSFLTGAQTPGPVYTQAPLTQAPPPPPPVPTPQPSPPPPPPVSYAPLSYTTISYWVPYGGGYEPGYGPYGPYREPYNGDSEAIEDLAIPNKADEAALSSGSSGVRLNVFDTNGSETSEN